MHRISDRPRHRACRWLPVAAEERQPLPDKLTFGYDEEGKVDASQAGCEAFVKEMVEWSRARTCSRPSATCARRASAHVEAYAAIQKSYKALVAAIRDDTRLEQAAVRHAASKRWSKLASTTNRD